MINPNYKIIPTPFNPLAIVLGEIEGQPKIQRIFLSNERVAATELSDQIYPYAEIKSCKQFDGIADKIVRFLNGEEINFSLEIVDLDLVKPFQKKILITMTLIIRIYTPVSCRQGLIQKNPRRSA